MTTVEPQLSQELEYREKQKRWGMISLTVLAAATTIAVLLDLVWSLAIGTSWIEPVIGLVASAILFVAVLLVRKGAYVQGVSLMAVTAFAFDIYLTIGFSGVGLPITFAFTSIISLIITQFWPPKQANKAIFAVIFTGILIILLDLYWHSLPWAAPRAALYTADAAIIYIATFIVFSASLIVTSVQFSHYTLRGKVTFISVLLLILTIGLVVRQARDIAYNTLTEQLDTDMEFTTHSVSETAVELLTQQVQVLRALSLDRFLHVLVQNQTAEYGDPEYALTAIEELEAQWADEDGREILEAYIADSAASHTLTAFQETFTDHLNILAADKYGGLVGATYIPDQYTYRDTVWWQAAYNNGDGSVYIGQPIYDHNNMLVIPIAVPIYTDDRSDIIGVLYTSYDLRVLLALSQQFEKTGTIEFLFDGQEAILDTANGTVTLQPPPIDIDIVAQMLSSPDDLLITNINTGRYALMFSLLTTEGELPALDNLNWGMVAQQEYAEAFESVETLKRASLVLGIIAVLTGGLVTAYTAGLITKPIDHLTETAVSIAEGNINQYAAVETKDEIGTLAIAFNSMTDQLRGFISSLEERVASRTHVLTTSFDVSRTLSTIVSVEALVDEVVQQMVNAFGYYHAQLLLLDEEGEFLVLHSGSGKVGQKMVLDGHKIRMGEGVIGRAAMSNEVVLINDVMQDTGWLYNANLPHTKSEIGVPISIGDRVLGILDIQHDAVHVFNEDTVNLLQAIAAQTALALQNARTFERAEQQQLKLAETLTISEQQSRNLSLLNELSTSLTIAADLGDVYRIAEMHIMEMMHADRVSILNLSPSGTELKIVSVSGIENVMSAGTSIPIDETVAGIVIRENEIMCFPNKQPLVDCPDYTYWRANSIKSVVLAPLSVGTNAFGVLNIGSTREDFLDSIDIGFVRQLANILSVTIESQRLAERAQLLAGIVENHPDFIGVGTIDGKVTYINPSGLAMMGLSADHDVSKMNRTDFYTPIDADNLITVGLSFAIEHGQWVRETALRSTDGSWIPVEETVGINYDMDNKVVGFNITMRDMTIRHAAAAALQSSEQAARDFQEKLTRLHEIGTTLGNAETLNDIYRQAIELGRSLLGFDRLGLWLFDADTTVMFGTFGIDTYGIVQDESEHMEPIRVAGSWVEPLLQAKQRRQVRVDTDLFYNGEVVGRGWSIVTILYYEEKPLGWLAVDNLLHQRPMQSYEPELLNLFTNLLANVIVRKRMANISSKRARELQIVTEISRAASGMMERSALLQFVVDEIKKQFDLYHVRIFLLHEKTGTLRLTAVSTPQNHPPIESARQVMVNEQACTISRAAYQRKAIIVNDLSLKAELILMDTLPNTRAMLAVPLSVGRELLGIINLYADEPEYFTEVDIDVQTALASQLAAALRNVDQYQEVQEALAELTQLQRRVSREDWKAFADEQTEAVQGYLFNQYRGVQAIKDGVNGDGILDKTAVYAPLTVRGTAIGSLSARNPSGEPLTDDQKALLAAAADQIAAALERARLLETTELSRQELDKRVEQLAVINEVAQVVSKQVDESELFRSVHEQVARAVVTDTFFIAIYDDVHNYFTFPYFYDNGEMHQPEPMDVDSALETVKVWQSSKPICVNYTPEQFWDSAADDHHLILADSEDEGKRPSNMVFIPLKAGAKVIGVMSVQNYQFHDFTEDDVSLLSGIANHVGLALENLHLFAKAQARARREQLTREITAEIGKATDVKAVLKTTARVLTQALGASHAFVRIGDTNEQKE